MGSFPTLGATSGEEAPQNYGWADRRPIAAVFLAQSGQGWPKNPRGYFADPELDVTTEAGRAELRRRMLEVADRTIARCREVGAQGVVVWDIEGGEMPHAITYLGDPTILPRVAPEMNEIADEFFVKFREAGLGTGICIRPTRIVYPEEGNYPWIKSKYGHTHTNDHAQVLIDKISYAKKRWGCTNFYIDTNVAPRIEDGKMVRKRDGSPDMRLLTADEIARVQAAHPDVLLWPEFQEPDYFATSSGYGEFREVGEFSAAERKTYPQAFRVWMSRMIAEDLYADWQRFLDQGPAKGEIFLFETSPTVNAMGDVMRNAASELALRQREEPFDVAETTAGRIGQLRASTNWAERRILIDALAGDPDPEATAALAEVLNHETNGLQWFAGCSLGRQPTDGSLEVLMAAASKPGPAQAPAVRGLGSRKDPAVVTQLAGLLDSKEPAIRWSALDALAEQGNPAAGPALREFLAGLKGSTAVNSRNKSLRALGRIGDKDSVPVLQAALKDPEFARQSRIIRQALAELGEPEAP